jgi:VanZ family protein
MRFLKYHLPVILCAVGIFVSSLTTILSDRLLLLSNLDKVAHLLMYFIFAFLILRLLFVSNHHRPYSTLQITSFTLAFSYGIIIEICQYFLPSRTMEAMDIFSNGLGALLGIFIFKIINDKIKIRKTNGKDITV